MGTGSQIFPLTNPLSGLPWKNTVVKEKVNMRTLN